MAILEELVEKARRSRRRVLYPESTEARVLRAARRGVDEGILSEAVLIGKKEEVLKAATECGVSLDGLTLIEPDRDPRFDELAQELYELRKHKDISFTEARVQAKDPLIFSNLYLRRGYADGLVTGSVTTTADVVRAAITIVKPEEGVKVVSSSFIMETPQCPYGRVFVFADGGVVPDPDSSGLVDIAYGSASLYQKLLGDDPRVAFLSFSTKGSARHPHVEKVQRAVEEFRAKYPNIPADGELQLDAAIVPEVGARKAPESEIAGRANILIFPDLDAANIGYKLVERMGGATALGPILQGLAKPVNDLSRGCSVEDIFGVSAITVLLAG